MHRQHREITSKKHPKMGRNRKFQSVVRHQLEALNEPHCKPSCVSACTPRAHKHSQIKLSEHERRSRGTEATAFEIHGRYQDADCSHLPSNVLEPSRPQPFEPSDKVEATLTMNHGRTGHLAMFTLAQHLPRRSATTIRVAALVHAPRAAMPCERRAEIDPKTRELHCRGVRRHCGTHCERLQKAVTRLGDRSF